MYFFYCALSLYKIDLTAYRTTLLTDDLAGVKVLHGLDKVIEGGAVVLTLKDQNILANGDVNEGKPLAIVLSLVLVTCLILCLI